MGEEKHDVTATNKELLRQILGEQRSHSDRLGKIENAIIQLAATQERVRMLDEAIQCFNKNFQSFSTEIWAELKEIRQFQAQCFSDRVELREKTGEQYKDIEKIQTWKDTAGTEIKANSKLRGNIEKIVVGVVVACAIAVLGALYSFNKIPEVELQGLKTEVREHIIKSDEIKTELTEIKELLKKQPSGN